MVSKQLRGKFQDYDLPVTPKTPRRTINPYESQWRNRLAFVQGMEGNLFLEVLAVGLDKMRCWANWFFTEL